MGSSDSDIEVLDEVVAQQMPNSLQPEWRPLFEYIRSNPQIRRKHPECKNQFSRAELAASYVKGWCALHYTYDLLKAKIEDHEKKVKLGTVNSKHLHTVFFEKLKVKKEQNKIRKNVSLSNLIDRTFEHFQKIISDSSEEVDNSPEAAGSSSLKASNTTSYTGPPPTLPRQEPVAPGYQTTRSQLLPSAVAPKWEAGSHGGGAALPGSGSQYPPEAQQTQEDQEFLIYAEKWMTDRSVPEPQGCARELLALLNAGGLTCLELLRFSCFIQRGSSGGQFLHLLTFYANGGESKNLSLRSNIHVEMFASLAQDFCDYFCLRFPNFAPSVRDDWAARDRFQKIADAVMAPRTAESPLVQQYRATPSLALAHPVECPVVGSASQVRSGSSDSIVGGMFRQRGPHTPPGPSVQRRVDEMLARGTLPRVDAGKFKFFDQRLDLLNDHPLRHCKPLLGKLEDYLMVGVEMMSCGNGIDSLELLQLGTSLANQQRFLYPMELKNVRLKPQYMPATHDGRTKLRSQAEGLETMLKNLKSALGRSNSNGILLVTLNKESLVSLMRCIQAVDPGQTLLKDFPVMVKGFGILEPAIVQNCPDGEIPDGARIDHISAARLFRLSNPSNAEEMAVNTLRIAKILPANLLLRDCYDFSHSLAVKFQGIHKRLNGFGALRQHILNRLSKSDKSWFDRELTAVIHPFPEPGPLSSLPDSAVRLMLQLLAFRGESAESLTNICRNYGPQQTEDRLRSLVKCSLPGSAFSMEDDRILNLLLRHLVEQLHVDVSLPADGPRRRRIHDISPASTAYDSEGSMPEENRVSPGGLNSFEMTELKEDLCRQFKAQKGRAANLSTQLLEKVAVRMCLAWEEAGLPWPQLRQQFTAEDASLERRTARATERLLKHLGGEDSPLEWKGLTVKDLVHATDTHFQRRVRFSDPEMGGLERSFAEAARDRVPTASLHSVARTLTFVLEEAGFDHKRLTNMVTGPGAGQIARERLKYSINKQLSQGVPASWGGCDIDFVVNTVFRHFTSASSHRETSVPHRGERGGGSGNVSHTGKRSAVESESGRSSRREGPLVKKLRHDEEERWKKLKQSLPNSDLLAGLLKYCSRKKLEYRMYEEMDEQRIILELTSLADRKKYSLATVMDILKAYGSDQAAKERSVGEILKELFDEGSSSRQKRDFESDFLMLRALYERFCAYLLQPETLEEDLAAVDVSTEEATAAAPPPRPESPNSIQQVVEELQARYHRLGGRKYADNRAKLELHEHLFYAPRLREIIAYKSDTPNRSMAALATDILSHVTGYVRNLSSFKNIYQQRKLELVGHRSQKSQELGSWLDKQLGLDKLPDNFAVKCGLIRHIIQEHLDEAANPRPISQAVLQLSMRQDTSNHLTDLQTYLFHCYAETAVLMATAGDLDGFQLSDVDVGRLSAFVHKIVSYVKDKAKFDLYEALELYTEKGNLAEVLHNRLPSHEASQLEAVDHSLLSRLFLNYVAHRVRKHHGRSLQFNAHQWRALQRSVAWLVENGHFIKPERKEFVKMKLMVPLEEREVLIPLTPEGEEEESGQPNQEENEEVKSELVKSELASVPGCVLTAKVIVIPPRMEMRFHASVTGLRRLEKDAMVVVSPLTDLNVGVVLPRQTVPLTTYQTVFITVRNTSQKVVKLPSRRQLGQAVVKQEQMQADESPGYRLAFLRQYFSAHPDGKHIKDRESWIYFGEDEDVRLAKNSRTNFRITGSRYSYGIPDYYTVEGLVYFFGHTVVMQETYDQYVRLTIRFKKQVVHEADRQTLLDYLTSVNSLCPQNIDKNFTAEREQELVAVLTRLRSTEETAAGQLRLPMKEEEEEAPLSDGNTSFKAIFKELKEYLMDGWKMSEDQAASSLSLLLDALAQLGWSLPQLSTAYSSLPHHRELFCHVMTDLLRKKAIQMGHGTDKAKVIADQGRLTMEAIRYSERPALVRDMLSFCKLADICLGEINEQEAEGMLALLQASCEGQPTSVPYVFNDQLADTFESLVGCLGAGLSSLRPAVEHDPMIVYTGVSAGCFCSLVVQLQAEHRAVPVSMQARRLSPSESRGLSYLEKAAWAVLWGVAINHSLLNGETNVVVSVPEQAVCNMFADAGDQITGIWAQRLADAVNPPPNSGEGDNATATSGRNNPLPRLEVIRPEVNPALGLGLGTASSRVTFAAYNTLDLLEALFKQLLQQFKFSGPERCKWLKRQAAKERQLRRERIEQERLDGSGPSEDLMEEDESFASENAGNAFVSEKQDSAVVTRGPMSGSGNNSNNVGDHNKQSSPAALRTNTAPHHSSDSSEDEEVDVKDMLNTTSSETMPVLSASWTDPSCLARTALRTDQRNEAVRASNGHLLNQRSELERLQQSAQPVASFADLASFLAACLTSYHNFSLKDGERIAADCVRTFQLYGLSSEALESIFLAGATITTCRERLYSGLLTMMGELTPILPTTVDILRLISYTLVYYRARAQLGEMLRSCELSSSTSAIENRLQSLLPLVEHCGTRIASSRVSDRVIADVTIQERVSVDPGDLAAVKGTVVFLESPPPIRTILKVKGNSGLPSGLVVEEQDLAWDGDEIELGLTNTSETAAASVGSAVRPLVIATVSLPAMDLQTAKNRCSDCAKLFAEVGIDLHRLVALCRDVILGSAGVGRQVSLLALVWACRQLVRREQNTAMPLFHTFLCQAINYATRLKLPPSTKQEMEDTEEGEVVDTPDVEDGECLSDADSQEIVGAKSESSGRVSFPDCDHNPDDLLEPPVKQVEGVNIWQVLKHFSSDLDPAKQVESEQGRLLLAGKYLLPCSLNLQIEGDEMEEESISYSLDVLVLFAKFRTSAQALYVKKVTRWFGHLNIGCVHADHRKRILKALDDELLEQRVELEVMSRDVELKKYYQRFCKLMEHQSAEAEALPSTKLESYQPLFIKFYKRIFCSGFVCQSNWGEVCRVASEELVALWQTAGVPYTHLTEHMVGGLRARHREGKQARELKKIHASLLKSLQLHATSLPPYVELSGFVKRSMECLAEILTQTQTWQQEEQDLSHQDQNDDSKSMAVMKEAASPLGTVAAPADKSEDEGDNEQILEKLMEISKRAAESAPGNVASIPSPEPAESSNIPGLGGDELPATATAASSPEYNINSDSNDEGDISSPVSQTMKHNDDLSSDDAGKFYSDHDDENESVFV